MFYCLDADGKYQAASVGADGVYRSTSMPGFWINVNWLWDDELPDPQITFAEIAGFSEEMKMQLRALQQKGRATKA